MKLNRKIARLAASVLATAMFACATALPAMAADPSVSSNTVTITKTINMTGAVGAGVPKGTYNFTIAECNPSGLTGKESNAKTGILEAVNNNNPNLSVEFDGTAATENILLTFDTTKFEATGAGVYYYTISENDISNFAGMTKDANTYYLKVSVANAEGGGLTISSAVMYPENLGGGDQSTEAKVAGFTNTYTTTSLTVTKDVEGRFGDKKKQFSFEITLTDPNHADSFDHITSVTSTKGSEGAKDVKFENGVGKVLVTLADTESVTITGLPVGTTYEIVESNNAGYDVSYSSNVTQDNNDENKATGQVADSANNVTVTNTITNDAPATGVIMNVAPYVLMVGIAVAGCFVFLRKRRDD
ncbi:MAG: hypothetical protein DBX97_03590 [Collinsella tanakaei]|nr:MAG: hypothetical protein DBX97_03590 [Collinsella tanakaei]